MTKIVVLHGIAGDTPAGVGDFCTSLVKRLPRESFSVEPFYWWTYLENIEIQLQNSMAGLGWSRIRRELARSVGDAIIYRNASHDPTTYNTIHYGLHELAKKSSPSDKVVLIGHSLGSVVASDYVWDHKNEVDALFTMGSPIALWAASYPGFGKPVTPPLWLNMYDPADPIGMPLQSLNSEYRSAARDLPMSNGWWVINPVSAHLGYWKNKKVLDRIVQELT